MICKRTFMLTVEEPASSCPDFSLMTWAPFLTEGTASASASGNLMNLSVTDVAGVRDGIYAGIGTLVFPPLVADCNIRVRITAINVGAVAFAVWMFVKVNGSTIGSITSVQFAPGVDDYDYVIPMGSTSFSIVGSYADSGNDYYMFHGIFTNFGLMSGTVEFLNLP